MAGAFGGGVGALAATMAATAARKASTAPPWATGPGLIRIRGPPGGVITPRGSYAVPDAAGTTASPEATIGEGGQRRPSAPGPSRGPPSAREGVGRPDGH